MSKKNKRFFEDRTHRKVTRSNEKRESKSRRHQTKDFLHNFTGSSIDKDSMFDIMDELEDTEWSD